MLVSVTITSYFMFSLLFDSLDIIKWCKNKNNKKTIYKKGVKIVINKYIFTFDLTLWNPPVYSQDGALMRCHQELSQKLWRFFFPQIRAALYHWTWTPKQRVCMECCFDSQKPLLLVLVFIPAKCTPLEASI